MIESSGRRIVVIVDPHIKVSDEQENSRYNKRFKLD